MLAVQHFVRVAVPVHNRCGAHTLLKVMHAFACMTVVAAAALSHIFGVNQEQLTRMHASTPHNHVRTLDFSYGGV